MNEHHRRSIDAPLHPDARGLLMQCDHRIAYCQACRLGHTLFELVRDRFCARCRADLMPEIHAHYGQCEEIARRRDRTAVSTADAPAQQSADSDLRRRPARDVHTKPGCPMCGVPILPGQNVSFQRGTLLHMTCYEERPGRKRRS